MKKLALAALLVFVPIVSFAAPLTQTQAESLINVVRSSPGSPASAFTGLITAFSNITTTQASSLIGVIQSSPNSPASVFLGLLSSFTQDSSQTTNANTQPQSSGITCNGIHYDPCGSQAGTSVCLDNGSNAYCQPPQSVPAPVQSGLETLAPQPSDQNTTVTSQQSDTAINQENATESSAVAQDENLIVALKSLENYLDSALNEMNTLLNSLQSNYSQDTAEIEGLTGGSYSGTAADYSGRVGQLAALQASLESEIADTNFYIPIFKQEITVVSQAISIVQSNENALKSEPLAYFAAYTTPASIQATINEYPTVASTYEGYYGTWVSELGSVAASVPLLSTPMQCTVQAPSYAGSGGTISCYGGGVSASCRYSATASAGQPINISCTPSTVHCTYTEMDYGGAPMGVSCSQ